MLGEIIGAIGSIAGGLLGESGKRAEMAQQKEFAKQGIRWRVEDARAAGVHPALAMGASIPSYTPVGLGSSLAEGVSGAGQDISRAVSATMTQPERSTALVKTMQALELERAGLENDLLRAQILGITRPSVPSFPLASGDYPMPGQPGSATIASPFGLPDISVANPKLAQSAQDHFGEPLEWVYGLGNFIDSLAQSLTGHNPRIWKPPVAPTQGETYEEYQRRMQRNPMY